MVRMSYMSDFYIGILNGGKSKRMGYPKSLIRYNGLTLAEIIYREALKITNRVVFLGESVLPSGLKDSLIIPDSEGEGPLKAVTAAYNFKKCDWFLWAVDMPLITKDIIVEMIDDKKNYGGNLIPFNKDVGVYEPFCAYYSETLLHQTSLLYDSEKIYNMQRVLRFLEVRGCHEIFEKYREQFNDWNSMEEIPAICKDMVIL